MLQLFYGADRLFGHDIPSRLITVSVAYVLEQIRFFLNILEKLLNEAVYGEIVDIEW